MNPATLGRIVIVDDDSDFLAALSEVARKQSYEVSGHARGALALAELPTSSCDILLTDLMMPDMDGMTLLRAALALDPNLVVVLMTAQGEVASAVEAMKLGAFDYLVKPFRMNVLLATLERGMDVRRLRQENVQLRETIAIQQLCQAIAFSDDTDHVVATLADAAFQQTQADELSILLTSVDGKELIVAATRGSRAGPRAGERLPLERGIAGWVAQNREHLLLQGTVAAAQFGVVESRSDIASSISQPMLAGGKLVGVLNVSRQRPGLAFTPGQVKALSILANTGALALESKRLLDQSRLQSVALDAAANAIVITDRNAAIQWVNAAFSRLTGYTAAEVIGENPRLLRSGQHDASFYAQLWQCVTSGQVWSSELINRRKDGSLYHEEQTITPVRDGKGEIAHYIAIKQDITARKAAEEELRERSRMTALSADVGSALAHAGELGDMLQECTESLVRHLDAASARVWTLNAPESVLELQASAGLAANLDGFNDRISMGRHLIGRIAERRRPLVAPDLLADPQGIDPEWARREGVVSFAGQPLVVDESLVGVVAVLARHPLSESALSTLAAVAIKIALGIKRKQTEDELHRSETRLRTFIAQARDVIFDVDVAGRFVSLNPAFEAITGWAMADWLGKPFPPLLHPEDLDKGLGLFHRVLQGEQLPYFEIRIRGAQDATITVEITVTPVFEAGAIVGVNGIARDVTARKQLEEQYRQAQKMEAIGTLAGGVAHDFNNLLTVIQGYSEIMLAQMAPTDRLRDFIEQIHKSGERAALLTRQLLAFSRKQVLQPVILDLNMLLTDMEKMLCRLIGENIELTLTLAPDLGLVKIDAGQMEQVVMNLIVNARDAISHDGHVAIATSNVILDHGYAQRHPGLSPGSYVRVTLSDDGCGMDPATRARIFEPFFSTKGERGTGLGLATVFGIIQQSGGRIDVVSEVGVGTTFTIDLPRHVTSGAVETDAMAAPPSYRGAEAILLVEDQDEVRLLASKILKSYGYTVVDAASGDEALRICAQSPIRFDLLLTDVVMPKMSGRQLADRLQSLRPTLRVLYVSGYTDEAILQHGVLEVGRSFMNKPFSPEALAKKVRETLDATRICG